MEPLKGPISATLGVLSVVGLVALMGAFRPTIERSSIPIDTPPPPSTAVDAPAAALVDDVGAVIITPGVDGTTILNGLHRDGGKNWRVVLPQGVVPLGCIRCPDLLVSTPDAKLQRVVDGAFEQVDTDERLSDAIGISGMAAVQQNTALATSIGALGVRLRLLGAPFSRLGGAGRGVLVPLNGFQQANAVIGISANGAAAAAIATEGILRLGEWRMLGVRGDEVLLDRVDPGFVTRVEGAPAAAVCLSPDGKRVAFVFRSEPGTNVVFGAPRDLRTVTVTTRDPVLACDIGTYGVTLAVFDGDVVKLITVGSNGRSRERQVVRDSISSVQFCPGTGTAALQGAQGTVFARAGGSTQKIKSGVLSGCTTTGTPWFVSDRRVSWLKTP